MRTAAGLRWTGVPSCLLLLSLALAGGSARAAQGAWTPIIPGNMAFHSLVWDGQRDRLVLSPGASVTAPLVKTALALPLSGPPLWRELAEFPVQFGGSDNCGMVLDPRREQVVLYDSYHNTVWTLPLAEGGAWRRLNVTGTLPLPRRCFTLILDEPRDRLVLYGGLGYGGNLRGEVWVLPLGEPTTWSQLDLPPGGPVAREAHAAAYDPVNDRMIAFGGSVSTDWPVLISDETWALELAGDQKWVQLTPAVSPPARELASFVVDRRSRQALLYGGSVPFNKFGDLWSLSLDTGEWAAVEVPGGHPGARSAHAAVIDTLRHRMIVFGGFSGANETWALALDGAPFWERLSILGAPPARTSHALVADPRQSRLLSLGGRDSLGARHDVWQMRTEQGGLWLPLPTTGGPPPARWNHVAVMDTLRNRVLVHGGRNEDGLLGDLWALELGDTVCWRAISALGDAPSPREGHVGVIDLGRDVLLIHGGADGALCDDLYMLSLDEPSQWWRVTAGGDKPAPRRDHTLVQDVPRQRMILFGGDGQAGPLDDVWQLGLPGVPQWVRLLPDGVSPGPRRGHAAVFDWNLHRMVVFGGDNGLNCTHRSYALRFFNTPPDSVVWQELFPREPLPLVRTEHAVCQMPGGVLGLFMCGGEDATLFDDVWRMDYSSSTPVMFADVRVDREAAGARLAWRLAIWDGAPTLHIHRQEAGRARVRLTASPLPAQPEGSFFDADALPGAADYWIEDLSATESVWHGPYPLSAAPLPAHLALRAARAGDGATDLRFDLPRPGFVTLKVHDLRGRLVAVLAQGQFEAGSHAASWDGRDRARRLMASGIYLARLVTESGSRAVSFARVR